MGNATADLQDQSAIETDEGATCGYSQHDQSLVDMEDLRDRMAANDLETQGAGYKVGDKKGIYGSSEKDDHTLYNMTCQGIGTSCTVWVQDGKTFDGDTEESVKNLIRIFDAMYPKMVENYGSGEKIDVDKDGKIALMVYEMDPSFLGYFWDRDLNTRSQNDPYGNGMDMPNLNIVPRDINNLYNTMTHECQHLVNFAVTGGNSDSWLNETFSQCASPVCGIENLARDTYTNKLTTAIGERGCTIPFIFDKTYVANFDKKSDYEWMNSTVYASWFLFGTYLSAQTQGVDGGGNSIYKTVLDTHACTMDSLISVLTNMGVIGPDTDTTDMPAFVNNFNLALKLQDEEGAYGFNGMDITGFQYPEVTATALPAQLWGGGAASFSNSSPDTAFIPTNAAESMLFASVDPEALDRVTADVPDGEVSAGTTISLTCTNTGDVTIRYTMASDGTTPADPTENSAAYQKPIAINSSTVIVARVFGADGRQSKANTFTYTVATQQRSTNTKTGVEGGTHLPLAVILILMATATAGVLVWKKR
ncbi:MAG: chitobiase/beta-hexosaminidase C-terminal domain-containing protein [Eubacteriaceae bacterium]|nr:chitobiase/beta-hexosaminidase C-terminal domain-containing protein [Eubacteriaceae bacterium]